MSRGRQGPQGKPPEDQRVRVGLEQDVGGGAGGLGDGGARSKSFAFAASLFFFFPLLLLFRKYLLELARARDVVGVDVAGEKGIGFFIYFV